MKKVAFFFFAASFLFVNFASAREDCDGVHMGSHSDMNGIRTLFCSSYDSVMKTPEWDGNSETIQLKLSEAIGIGKKWLKNVNPKFDEFQIREISISRVGNSI